MLRDRQLEAARSSWHAGADLSCPYTIQKNGKSWNTHTSLCNLVESGTKTWAKIMIALSFKFEFILSEKPVIGGESISARRKTTKTTHLYWNSPSGFGFRSLRAR